MEELEEWKKSLERELARRTGRKDIEVTVGPWRPYDVSVSKAKDHHPIVDFYSPIRWDPVKVDKALKYAIDMLTNWEAINVLHEKAMRDSKPIFERIKAEFPDVKMDYIVLDAETHRVHVKKENDEIIVAFDLWPTMTEAQIEALKSKIREHVAKVREEGAAFSGEDYW